VVFVGVYAAFMLAERQRERVTDERRQQFQLALAQEIEDISRNARNVAQWVPQQMARLDSLVAAGARPPLQPMTEPVRVQAHMWEATLQSGGLDLFDVPTVYRISDFYSELNAGFAQLEQLRTLSEALLIPRLGQGPDAFYEPNTALLRPEYDWYPNGMLRLGELAERITEREDALVLELRAGVSSTGTAP
jgi:hypothetical protein